MSFLEWMGEHHNPGPTGTVEAGSRERADVEDKPRWKVFLSLFISMSILAAVYYLIFKNLRTVTWNAVGITAVVTLIYLLLGYFVHPEPNRRNMGWMGGVFDNPFRISDDMNRFLLFLALLLRPARFVSESLVDFVVLLLHAHESEARQGGWMEEEYRKTRDEDRSS